MIKVPVILREDYTVFLELHEHLLWFHSDVRKWTPEVKVNYLEDLNSLQNLVAVPLVALVEQENTKLAKFVKKIGFEFKQPFLGQDKKMYHIYGRSL